MELKILKNISNNDLEFFTKFLERNLHLKEVLTEYEKISYLDDINKFFFLFKNRESLRNSNYDFFLYYLPVLFIININIYSLRKKIDE